MSSGTLLYRYFFYDWLFRDASRGTPLERAAALRHNIEQSRWLPLYLKRWSVITLLCYGTGWVIESLGALPASAVFYVPACLAMSALAKNQIVAAVLTFVGMLVFFPLCYVVRQDPVSLGLPPFVQTALGRLSFVHMWIEALAGRLPLRDCLLFASLGVFWTFLSVKVLEARKWS